MLDHLAGTQIDAAVVTEPTELAIGAGHRGFVWTEVTVTGVAAHGSRPHLGVDAILKAGPSWSPSPTWTESSPTRPHPFLGPGNLHGSLITGGTEESTIPDQCVFTVERRTLPGETVSTVEADVAALLDRCRAADPASSSPHAPHWHVTRSRHPLTPPSSPRWQRRLPGTGSPAETVPLSYWADSAFIAAAGVPTVLYGPNGDGAHADIEWVSLSGTITCARVLTATALDICT